MGSEQTDDNYDELSASARQVITAWLLAAVLVTLLLTLVAPLVIA
jgi:hypothetical protein